MSLQNLDSDLKSRLDNLAYQKSSAFCYACYQIAPTGVCAHCGSDDLMRHLQGVGVEYGIDWVIEHLIEENIAGTDDDDMRERYDEMLDDCYPTTTIGCCEFYASEILKTLDPVAYRMGLQEYIDGDIEDGQVIEINSRYYRIEDIEEYVEQNLVEEEVTE